MTLRLAALAVVFVLLASACGGSDDGDLEAYCQLVRSGVGLAGSAGEIDAADFDALLDIAPSEIRPAVEQLANTARDLTEITELDQLFAAAFDPDAQAARNAFDIYAVDSCGVDEDVVASGTIPADTDALAEIADYVSTNFREEPWATKVRYVASETDGEVDGLTVTFVVRAAEEEPVRVCRALSAWLYSVKDADGPIEIIDDDLVVVRRTDSSGACENT